MAVGIFPKATRWQGIILADLRRRVGIECEDAKEIAVGTGVEPGKRVFLTGSTGLLGTALLPRLRSSGVSVTKLSRRPPEELEPVAGRGPGECVRGNLIDPGTYREALEGCHTVVHLAAVTGKAKPREYFEVNVEGTRRLLTACEEVGVERFLHVSSIAVKFGDLTNYPYGLSKLHAEELVRASRLESVVVRPTIIVGRGSSALLALAKLATLPAIPLFGSGRTRVQPIHVDDLADLLLTLVLGDSWGGSTFELGGPEIVSIESLLQEIRRVLGRGAGRVLHVPLRPLATMLSWLEPLALPILPLTAGQLSTFRYDGTIEANPLYESRRGELKGVEEMLRASLEP